MFGLAPRDRLGSRGGGEAEKGVEDEDIGGEPTFQSFTNIFGVNIKEVRRVGEGVAGDQGNAIKEVEEAETQTPLARAASVGSERQ